MSSFYQYWFLGLWLSCVHVYVSVAFQGAGHTREGNHSANELGWLDRFVPHVEAPTGSRPGFGNWHFQHFTRHHNVTKLWVVLTFPFFLQWVVVLHYPNLVLSRKVGFVWKSKERKTYQPSFYCLAVFFFLNSTPVCHASTRQNHFVILKNKYVPKLKLF